MHATRAFRFDELLVGAPFYYEPAAAAGAESVGGAVFVYYSTGRQAAGAASSTVFAEPIIIKGIGGSQFGLSLTGIGDTNKDGFQGESALVLL